MSNSRDFVAFCLEALRPLGPVSTRAMFGGHCLYLDGRAFALIAGDVLYFKVDDLTRPAFEAEGLTPFRPFADKPDHAMNYYTAPDEGLDDPDALLPWARLGFEAALRAPAPKKRGKKGKG